MSIIYTQGDATQPIGEGTKIIVHVCNDIGGWGRGIESLILEELSAHGVKTVVYDFG